MEQGKRTWEHFEAGLKNRGARFGAGFKNLGSMVGTWFKNMGARIGAVYKTWEQRLGQGPEPGSLDWSSIQEPES